MIKEKLMVNLSFPLVQCHFAAAALMRCPDGGATCKLQGSGVAPLAAEA